MHLVMMLGSEAVEHRTQDREVQGSNLGFFATIIDALMWPVVRLKHERAHKIQN